MFVLLGAIAGVLGFLPLFCALRASKKVSPHSNLGYGALLMLGVFASLLILIVVVLLCYFFAREELIRFVLSTAITLIIITVVYGIYTVVKRNKAAKERAAKQDREHKDK